MQTKSIQKYNYKIKNKFFGGRITVSSDAHSAAAICCAFDKAEALAKSCGFTELWQFNGSGFDAVEI